MKPCEYSLKIEHEGSDGVDACNPIPVIFKCPKLPPFQKQECHKMRIDRVELINVPQPNVHKVEVAKVKSIFIKELQIGDVILFGFNLLLIQDIIPSVSQIHDPTTFRVSAMNLSTGLSIGTIYPEGTVLHRVIECDINELDTSGNVRKGYGWKRLRKPILGEMTYCGACDGECSGIEQEDIDRFVKDIESEVKDFGSLSGCYDPIHDRFLGYDGCESGASEVIT